MKIFFRSFLVAAAGLMFAHMVSAATISPTGPSQVGVGQTFQVSMTVDAAVDVDTIRLNGAFSADLLQYVGVQMVGALQSVSPGTMVEQANGTFSVGSFSLDGRANGSTKLAIFTFKAKKAGTATVQLLDSSHVLSAGKEELEHAGNMRIVIGPESVMTEQPEPIPPSVPPGTVVISLMSPNMPNPNFWYATGTVQVVWSLVGKDAKTTYIGFDQSPDGTATTLKNGTSATFIAPSDGIWYVHLRFVFDDGTMQSATLRVQIDRTPPASIAATADQTNVPPSVPNTLHFGTTDESSGIDHYDILIDGVFVASTTAQSYPLDLTPGSHTITVIAYDLAGNSSSGETHVVIIHAPSLGLKPIFESSWWLWLVLSLLFLVSVGVLWFLRNRQK